MIHKLLLNKRHIFFYGIQKRAYSLDGTSTILRKLGPSERGFCFRETFKNVTTAVRIKSKIDLFKDLDKFKQSVKQWKQMHSFLRANIVFSNDQTDLFYALNETSSVNVNLENVHFLTLTPNNRVAQNLNTAERENLNQDLQTLFLEHSLSDLVDVHMNSELLWKLFVLDIGVGRDEYEFILFFSISSFYI